MWLYGCADRKLIRVSPPIKATKIALASILFTPRILNIRQEGEIHITFENKCNHILHVKQGYYVFHDLKKHILHGVCLEVRDILFSGLFIKSNIFYWNLPNAFTIKISKNIADFLGVDSLLLIDSGKGSDFVNEIPINFFTFQCENIVSDLLNKQKVLDVPVMYQNTKNYFEAYNLNLKTVSLEYIDYFNFNWPSNIYVHFFSVYIKNE